MVKGYLLVFLSAAGFGLMTIFASFGYDSGVNVTTLLFLRFAIASLCFFAYLFFKTKKWSIMKRQLLSLLLLGGILYTLQSSLYFSSVQYISKSLAALLLYLYPVFVAVLAFIVNKERLSLKSLISILISLAGMVFVLGSPSGNLNGTGVLLAVAAGIVYSVYIVIGNRVALQVSPIITSAFITLFASVSLLLSGMFSGALNFKFEPVGWLPIVAVALCSTVLSIFTFFAGMNITGPTKASIVSMVEPVVTIMASTLLLQEKMSQLQIIGGLIVLTGAVLVVLAGEKEKAPAAAKNLSVKVE